MLKDEAAAASSLSPRARTSLAVFRFGRRVRLIIMTPDWLQGFGCTAGPLSSARLPSPCYTSLSTVFTSPLPP